MNSIFGKKGCKKCTETVVEDEDGDEESYEANFGYVAKDGDIWIYTGVTSVNDDASNIGFILVWRIIQWIYEQHLRQKRL